MIAVTALIISLLATLAALGWSIYVMIDALTKGLYALELQGFAAHFGYDPTNRLAYVGGCVLNSECYPLLWIAWRFYYGQQWVWWVVFAVLLVVVLVLARVAQREPRDPEIKPGEGHWATPEQLRTEGYLPGGPERPGNPRRGYVGLHLETAEKMQVPERMRFSHTLVVGGPGARKSTGYHKQNIIQDMRDGVNIILFDLKYPDPSGGFFDMVMLAEHYRYELQLLLPYDEHSHRFSFLAGATTETAAREVASLVIPVSKNADASEYYRNNERIMLTSMILAAARSGGSFKDIVDGLRNGMAGVRKVVTDSGDTDANLMLKAVLDGTDPDKQKGIINGLLGKVEIFGDPQLLRFGTLSSDPSRNVDLSKLHSGRTMVYIGIPQQKLTSSGGQVFLQMMKSTIDKELGRISRDNRGTFATPISYYLDEFANFGPLPDIGSDFATMRSRRLSYHVTVQNMAQGSAVYGREEWESFFRSNFQTVLIFPRFLRFGDAELFSKLAGNLTSLETSESEASGGLLDANRHSVNVRSVRRAMMSTESMKEWPDAEGVVFLNGVAPARVVLPRFDEPKIRGRYKNPYIADYRRIDYDVDAVKWVEHYFTRREALRKRRILEQHLEVVTSRLELERKRAAAASTTTDTATTPTAPSSSSNGVAAPVPAPSAKAAPPPPPTPTATPTKVTSSRAPAAPARATASASTQATNTPPALPGARRFNTVLQALIRSRAAVASVKVASGKRVTELHFAPSAELEAHYRPHADLLAARTGYVVEHNGIVGLTRRGLSVMTPNVMGYYFQLGAASLDAVAQRAMRQPASVPVGEIKKNAAKRELRRVVNRAHRRGQIVGVRAPHGGTQVAIPLRHIPYQTLETYKLYWQGYFLARLTRDHLVLDASLISYLPSRVQRDLLPRITEPTTPPATTVPEPTGAPADPPEPAPTPDTAGPETPPETDAVPSAPEAVEERDAPEPAASQPAPSKRSREKTLPSDQPTLSFDAQPDDDGTVSVAVAEPAIAEDAFDDAPEDADDATAEDAPPPDAEAAPATVSGWSYPRGPAEPLVSIDGFTFNGDRDERHARRIADAWRAPLDDDCLEDALLIPAGSEGSDGLTSFLVMNAPHIDWFDDRRPPGLTAKAAPGKDPYVARVAWGTRVLVRAGDAVNYFRGLNPSFDVSLLRDAFTVLPARYKDTRCAWIVLTSDAVEDPELALNENIFQRHQYWVDRAASLGDFSPRTTGADGGAQEPSARDADSKSGFDYLPIIGMVTLPVATLQRAVRDHVPPDRQAGIINALKNVRTIEHRRDTWVQLLLRLSEVHPLT